ncbi:uncharacterized protein LOC105204276 [Solenopsis invicta]|uniref:uncharacterized protein LOC105204276 n=1 Tax=Solenopsis invicta TaxID=13686 RepID=UPI00193CB8F3|nr:uncharacterized protein LOC105204276 [Solenopsis invicta]
MGEQTWTIVQFEEDETVEAVPSTWIQGQYCHWPTYSHDKLRTAIKKHETLNTCWPVHKIKSFKNFTFNDYLKARSKACTAEYTSDLNSEAEYAKRKRIPKRISSSSSEENLQTLLIPSPPILKNKDKRHKNDKENFKPANESPIILPSHSTETIHIHSNYTYL